MVVTAVVMTSTQNIVLFVDATMMRPVWLGFILLLEMAIAMMRPILQSATMMMVTVVDLVSSRPTAQIVHV